MRKSKGGLTRHVNSIQRETATDLLEDEKSRLTFESLAGIVEAIKTSLCSEDLYGTDMIASVKIATCMQQSFA